MRKKRTGPIAGFVLGTQFAVKSLEPSLMPRSAIDQGLVMAGSFVTGYVVGSAAARVVGLLPVLTASGALRVLGVGAKFIPKREHETRDTDSDLETQAWIDTGADILSSVALGSSISRHPKSALNSVAGIGTAGATVLDAREALSLHKDTKDANYIATSVGTAAGVAIVAASVVGGVRLVGFLAKKVTGTKGAAGSAVQTVATIAATVSAAYGVKAVAKQGIGKIAAGNRAVETAYARPPESPNVSGSETSDVPFSSLGLQGRRLVLEVTSTETIEAVMQEPLRREPVRVYVGIESAVSPDDRIDLAIEELERAGGFDRSVIVVASPAGTGYVNYIAVEACELMARGDAATVAIQYGSLPSMLSLDKIAEASRVYGDLVKRLNQEIDARGLSCGLYAYGESLGALAGQNGILAVSSGTDLPVEAALWVGTPAGSELFETLTSHGDIPVFDRPAQLLEHVEDANAIPKATFLNHDNDPVTKFTPSSFYRMPEWFRQADRGRGVSEHQRWLPGVAFFQGLIDTKNAATVVPGEFGSTGHDYRADLATFIKVAYGFSDVDDEQLARVEAQLRSSEIARSVNIAEGKVHTA